ncbi:hypothetical protein [Limnohabitans sp.]|uniref:hypothetical protein n=1 Tax=Limnohabitans sp. TaxID=1907725 RepID=UPI00286EE4DA|nr:hypothetical protein [Limnohabitans sp.]
MSTMQINLFEALTDAGVKPEAARNVERQVEAAIQSSHDSIQNQLFTKADAAQLEHRLEVSFHKAINELTWKLVTFVIAANGIMLAALKHFG